MTTMTELTCPIERETKMVKGWITFQDEQKMVPSWAPTSSLEEEEGEKYENELDISIQQKGMVCTG